VTIGPLLYVWELFQDGRHRLECAFLGMIAGAVNDAAGLDRAPAGGARRRRLVDPGDLPALRVFPAALATPGLREEIRRFADAPAGRPDFYLGVEGAPDPLLPHRLNARAVLADGDRLLLVTGEGAGFWVLPGGLVEDKESVEQAVVRETAEETGLAVTAERLLYVREFVDPALREHGIECYFLGRVIGGALRNGAEVAFRDISTVRGQVSRAAWWDRTALAGIVVYPGEVRDRLWRDLSLGGPDRFLGTARLAPGAT